MNGAAIKPVRSNDFILFEINYTILLSTKQSSVSMKLLDATVAFSKALFDTAIAF